ncbi:SURF1 family protein [Sphingomonas sp. IC-56]|uniref:SURF1 family cytochrome oxidase biogenesis protein n=1 Tax=Sphingomonas sp. IC-56 TaxID=2898529 RepID=UPI001E593E19|nr:SURF1 family cytochrome oxidase biogenesis protein [Sphingomonas sp. IC-56]MCD2325136.1 SURF1 family protein [Sphingomonas sp. IC-56]
MRRMPVVPTVLVTLAIAAMIALGFWQLFDRLPKKEAFLAQLATNPAKPPIAFPRSNDDRLLFRRVEAMCLQPMSSTMAGAGASGFRWIVECRTKAEAPMAVQLGTTRDPLAKPVWKGGVVRGYLSHAPDSRPMIAALFEHTPQRLMVVADTPPAGLAPNAAPDLSSVPNNHLAYGVQWFLFAAVAAVIYVLALRLRNRGMVRRERLP